MNKIKPKHRKRLGFTLVELLVVIGILAVLATVSVVGYLSFVKKAKVSNDVSLTTQINTVLASNEAVDGKNVTPYDAITELKEDGGFDINKISPTASGYFFGYDKSDNRMVLFDEYMSVVAPEGKSVEKHESDVFLLVANEDELKNIKYSGYSFYLKDGFVEDDDETIEVSTSLDVGENKIHNINYTNTGSGKDVLIRTNSVKTSLTVNAPNDTIYHYGVTGLTNLLSVNTSSYHEFGKTPLIEVSKGRVVLESGSEVPHIHIATKIDSISDGNVNYNGNEFDEVIVSLKNSENTPNFTRDAVNSIPDTGTLVVEVEKDENDSDFIWLYQQGVIQQIRVSDNKNSAGDVTAEDETVDNETHSVASDLANNLADGKTWDSLNKDESGNITETDAVVDSGIASQDKEDYINNVVDKASIDMGIDEYDYWIDIHSDSFAGGKGTQDEPYLISNGRELSRLAYLLTLNDKRDTYKSAYYELKNDINLSGKCWTPISAEDRKENRTTNETKLFTGNFDGKGYTITGLTNNGLRLYEDVEHIVNDTTPTDSDGEYSYGLFGTVGTCTIKNIKFAKVAISTGIGGFNSDNKRYVGDSVGALVGATVGNTTNIENIKVLSGSIEGYDATGGIVGRRESGKLYLSNCSNAANVTAVRRSAGLVGYIPCYSFVIETSNEIKTINLKTSDGDVCTKFTSCSNSGDITSLGVINDFENGGKVYYGACAITHVYADYFNYDVEKHNTFKNTVDGFTNTGKIKTIISENKTDTDVYYFYDFCPLD